MPKEYGKGTFGQWMQMQIRALYDNLWTVHSHESKNVKEEDLPVWENNAAIAYSQLDIMQAYMADNKLSMTDRMPDEETVKGLNEKAKKQAEDPAFKEPFTYDNISSTMDTLKMFEEEPPEAQSMFRIVGNQRVEREFNKRCSLREQQRKQEWERRTVKYPPNTYGAWMQELASELQGRVHDLKDMISIPGWKVGYEKFRNSPSKPAMIANGTTLQQKAGKALLMMRLLQEKMNSEGKGLDDAMPPVSKERHNDWKADLANAAAGEAEKAPASKLFEPENLDKTAQYFHLENPKALPALDDVLLPYSKLLNEKHKAVEWAKQEKREREEENRQREERERAKLEEGKAVAKDLLKQLKKTTQKSFTGMLKSFFVGNSKEYTEAIRAIENYSTGAGEPKAAREAIQKYLDLRGNKVRDHKYGKDRFDLMLKGLALVTKPREFVNECDKIDTARDARSNGEYTRKGGRIDPASYLSEAEIADVERDMRREDIKAIELDAKGNVSDKRAMGETFKELKKLGSDEKWDAETIQGFKDFLRAHPGARDTARQIVEKNHLPFRVPDAPADLDNKHAEMLKEQDQIAREYGLTPEVKPQEKRSSDRGIE